MVLRVNYLKKNGSLSLKEAAEICLQCGVCCVVRGHSCHVQYDERFDPKYTYVYDCLGTEDPACNPNIWLCVSCHKCEEVCPYEVSPVEFIEEIKAQAFEMGYAHHVILEEVEQVVSTGYAFPLTGASTRQRKILDLKPLEMLAAEELRLLAQETGLAPKLQKYKEEGA